MLKLLQGKKLEVHTSITRVSCKHFTFTPDVWSLNTQNRMQLTPLCEALKNFHVIVDFMIFWFFWFQEIARKPVGEDILYSFWEIAASL